MTKPGGKWRAQIGCVLLRGRRIEPARPVQAARAPRQTAAAATRARGCTRSARPDDATVVVLGAAAIRLRNLLRRSAGRMRRTAPVPRVAYNALWRAGLAGSLRAGLDALPRSARAALVMLVDQPNVEAAASAAVDRRVAHAARHPRRRALTRVAQACPRSCLGASGTRPAHSKATWARARCCGARQRSRSSRCRRRSSTSIRRRTSHAYQLARSGGRRVRARRAVHPAGFAVA